MIAAHGIIQKRRQKAGEPSTKYFFQRQQMPSAARTVRALPHIYVFAYLHQPFQLSFKLAGITNTTMQP